jgi:hypothetical protein
VTASAINDGYTGKLGNNFTASFNYGHRASYEMLGLKELAALASLTLECDTF